MDDEEFLKSLGELLDKKQAIKQSDLESVLRFFDQTEIGNGIFLRPLLMKSTGSSIREDDFMTLIISYVIQYILSHKDYKSFAGLSNPEITRKVTDLYQKARKRFLKKNKKTGEPGELILFLLLESQGIHQIISKMRLKTSSEWPVHGFDAIHIEVKGDEIIFHYGESKMYKNFNDAIKSALESMKNFENEQKSFDLELVSFHIDNSKFENYSDRIIEILDPYYPDKEHQKDEHPIFIGYDWKVLKEETNLGKDTLSEYYVKKYIESHDNLKQKILHEVSESGIKNKTIKFHILPFADVEKFRNVFLETI